MAADQGRLDVRPAAIPAPSPSATAPAGERPIGLGGQRDGLVHVPPSVPIDRPAPLVVMLHGAGGAARGTVELIKSQADAAGVVLLVPESRGRTWDVILGGYGPDVRFLADALRKLLSEQAIDPRRIAVAGFSDGASYALSLGLTNGDLFSHILAFAPGFMAPASLHGRPAIYVSHGTEDGVLPIEVCSRRLVPALQRAGYPVRYHEFPGGHAVPPDIAQEGVDMFLAGRS